MLAAFHRAHAVELQHIIAMSPVGRGMRVLDVCCGDGAQTLWLAHQVGPRGTVVGLDLDAAFLQRAGEQARRSRAEAAVYFLQGDAQNLPFEAQTFDVAWCAHSLYEVGDAVGLLRGMKAVVRPGGAVCVLENDRLHHALLPWPPELELALQRAYRQAICARRGSLADTFYVARHLPQLFHQAGLEGLRLEMHTTTRRAPLDPDEREYLELFVEEMSRRAWRYLSREERRAFEAWRRGDGGSEPFDDPSFNVAFLDVLAWAPVPVR